MFLGAGFSQPAGLPLGSELFREVRNLIRAKYGPNTVFERDLERYIEYVSACEGKAVGFDDIDYEEFLGFLDVEHFLRLTGSDTWSAEGNRSQLMVKCAIAEVLHRRTPKEPPALHRAFARRLNPFDFVFTFNYDTLLESALEAENVPYRLFPQRYSKIARGMKTVDHSEESDGEVIVLKLHGSIDWCDSSGYEELVEHMTAIHGDYEVEDPVFGVRPSVPSVPLTDGRGDSADPLRKIHRVQNLEPLIQLDHWSWSPLIFAPSAAKLPYLGRLRNLWWDSQGFGGANLSIGVVGYSLPPHDEYARQVLYHVFSNYTGYTPDLELEGRKKTPIRILDFAPADDSGADIRSRYRFADWSRTELRLDGFNESTVEWLLA